MLKLSKFCGFNVRDKVLFIFPVVPENFLPTALDMFDVLVLLFSMELFFESIVTFTLLFAVSLFSS